ncbi:UDP kinase [Candidatus Gottesmanbacteria bacterium CG11_big_fil_rev_8_21_14_0_20_37_11]|uniref:UDP kinase n=2 Tax=Candidatus Gottesmaniibacteriota TaxID=1752720 RepID=A0A2M7RSG6_9BACT|nr:MAG: UDP kinase [Candidatus Gottesmanbacteria bacterium CG23_combo_of_CG06-09_8_20_14_all_37_19]PIR08136.1 MAG: UDP kinase [Candidatus Gottesmanbacteria bacterium CG11_big_fil_rev_8_21_14_0_20_37_11]PIZ02914.1 MAG: UDP kinase [Candidatus Gottesmanbacteria bacterium CG_4_10_14_0_8_um_filter_37_24]
MILTKRHNISFRHAFEGIVWAFSTQPNFRIHIFLSILAIILALVLEISYLETVVIIFTIVFGLGMEMVNTSIESITDLVTNEWKKEAKIAKDVSAGMMLLAATGAVIVASLIFIPHIIRLQ